MYIHDKLWSGNHRFNYIYLHIYLIFTLRNCIRIYIVCKTLNVAKMFSLEQGGDLRCFILDNHRPIHLANVYSRHNVVIFDSSKGNTSDDDEEDNDSIPSDGSILSIDSDDSATSDEDEETVSVESVR